MAAQGPSAVPLGEPAGANMKDAAAAAEPPESESRSAVAILSVDMADADSEGSEELDGWEWLLQAANNSRVLRCLHPQRR